MSDAPSPGVTARPLGPAHRAALLGVAADTIGGTLAGRSPAVAAAGDDPVLDQPAATFVSLARGEAVLGCVGTLVPSEALVTSVARNARAVAVAGRQGAPVTMADFTVMSIRVSVLSRLRPVRARSWRDVRRAVRPGCDGLVLEIGGRQATLLPTAWDTLADPAQFLDVLWHKAGLRPRDWLPRTSVLRYTTEELIDSGPRPAPTT